MSQEVNIRKRLFMLLGLFVLAFLACNPFSSLPDDAALNEAGTQVAMGLTQTAQAMPTVTSPTQVSPTATEIALPIISESVVAALQVDFFYDQTIFSQVERVFEEGYAPEGVDESIYSPDHLFFALTYADESVDGDFYGILVWPADEYASMNPYAAQTLSELEDLLQRRPALELNADYPVLPAPMAAMWMSTQVEYLTFQNGSGIRYVVQRVQQAAPISNQSLRYRFLGLTEDGKYYVSATFMAAHPLLPANPEQYLAENGTDWNTFVVEDQSQYRVETAELLAGQSPDSFDPSLLVLDEMMQSLKVGD
ncbi:MAG: hypothetical protein DWQ07_06590 [Chloroflexi bacterium]|nr:MAG: hypothetical protein DWQ07_06590 [Chloroflexota bacterium]MBL1195902.1 hypothetical protein [Chloroflexota bacterium]NOH13194.1 hypothetical protein [Chloroflexota bacterium]